MFIFVILMRDPNVFLTWDENKLEPIEEPHEKKRAQEKRDKDAKKLVQKAEKEEKRKNDAEKLVQKEKEQDTKNLVQKEKEEKEEEEGKDDGEKEEGTDDGEKPEVIKVKVNIVQRENAEIVFTADIDNMSFGSLDEEGGKEFEDEFLDYDYDYPYDYDKEHKEDDEDLEKDEEDDLDDEGKSEGDPFEEDRQKLILSLKENAEPISTMRPKRKADSTSLGIPDEDDLFKEIRWWWLKQIRNIVEQND